LSSDNKRILVVDDDRELLTTLVKYFELKGVLALGSESAEEAQGIIESGKKFDLMIIDIVLPGMSGVELLKAVKKTNPDQKVIVMTGMLSIENTLNALREGAVEYLLKPFSSLEYIWSVIEEYL
jgi:DNA-binding NtrC family response regulator